MLITMWNEYTAHKNPRSLDDHIWNGLDEVWEASSGVECVLMGGDVPLQSVYHAYNDELLPKEML